MPDFDPWAIIEEHLPISEIEPVSKNIDQDTHTQYSVNGDETHMIYNEMAFYIKQMLT